MNIKKYLEEKMGINSLMRLQSLVTLIFSFAVIIWQIAKGTVFIELDILLITASFAPKAIQKFAEAKMYTSSSSVIEKSVINKENEEE